MALLHFSIDDIGSEFRTDVALMDMQTKKLFSDKVRMIYLQLPRFRKEADDCENDFERWIYVLKNMDTLTRMPWMAQNSVFQRLAQIADISAMTKEERLKYDEGLKQFRDAHSVFEGARREGEARGRAAGLREGKMSTALNMKNLGMATDIIMQVTGLSAEEIEKL